jgi:hypothetical protein
VSSGSGAKTLLLSLLISFTFISIAGNVHFRPVDTSLFVSAWFVFMDSLLEFFLSVVLDLAVKAVFPIPIGVASSFWSGLESSVTWLRELKH